MVRGDVRSVRICGGLLGSLQFGGVLFLLQSFPAQVGLVGVERGPLGTIVGLSYGTWRNPSPLPLSDCFG